MKPFLSNPARRIPLAAAGLALTLAAAACTGSGGTPQSAPVPPTTTESTTPTPTADQESPTTPTTPSTPTRPANPPSGPDRCHTADLTARVIMLDAAAGSRYAALILKNRSTSTCRIYGYGGVQLLDAARAQLPTHQLRDRSRPPRPVLLRPGASANSRLHWHPFTTGAESPAEPCQPNPSYLLVTPPDETQPITIAWPFGPVCPEGTISQSAYAPSTTPRD